MGLSYKIATKPCTDAKYMPPILRKEVYMHDKNYIKDSSRHTRIINNYSTNHWDVYYFSLIKEKEACEWDL